MMTLKVECSNHDHWKEPRHVKIAIDDPRQLDPQNVKERIERQGWIVQFNGDNMDTYCSVKCAK